MHKSRQFIGKGLERNGQLQRELLTWTYSSRVNYYTYLMLLDICARLQLQSHLISASLIFIIFLLEILLPLLIQHTYFAQNVWFSIALTSPHLTSPNYKLRIFIPLRQTVKYNHFQTGVRYSNKDWLFGKLFAIIMVISTFSQAK